ncbi:CYTH and CHAD domain-containing protein [Streptomyces litchfieldiae]|uniref:CYTH and CHAD domain-containing protein n=1 Tax=Streptomyces litchfieldiae TaxID=3075543 RepID=A0ABU2MMP6_9ACTN|nr:CYTH and CHAD domain-containing protein [Streptomyces sp. DSM 44938]MDT0342750.1 CYTH and CHAD domain-containing protein [Streptomyces sp. DSM 44938]
MSAQPAITSTTETERKYEGALPLPELAGAGEVRATRDAGAHRLNAVYYDTPGQRLAADGVTLRRRTGGSDEGWHLKLPLGGSAREEIRAPLADEPPAALLALARSRIRHEPLGPVVTLATDRRRRELLDASGTVLAEVAVDTVSARRGEATAEWTEVEVELAPGADPAVLDAVEERLAAAGARPSASASKLARALAETAAAAAPEQPEPAAGTAGAEVLAYARGQLAALIRLDPAVRRDRHDSVHQMRVATRRLRSCLRSYGRVLDRAATRPVEDELRWLAGELGTARDREVLADRLAARLAELPAELRTGPVARRLARRDDTGRAAARERVTAALDSSRYLALLDTLDLLLRGAPPLRRAAGRPAAKVLAGVVRREGDRLAGRLAVATELPAGPDRDDALHVARKAAKRARYAAEAATPALGGEARRRGRRWRRVQEVLGDHHDSVVAREALAGLAAEAEAAGEPSFAYGVLWGREAELAAAGERTLATLRVR